MRKCWLRSSDVRLEMIFWSDSEAPEFVEGLLVRRQGLGKAVVFRLDEVVEVLRPAAQSAAGSSRI